MAQRLNYAVISRDLLLDASERYHIPEIKLIRAIHDAPGILARFSHGKQAYLAYIRSALADRAAQGRSRLSRAGRAFDAQISPPVSSRYGLPPTLKPGSPMKMAREKISAEEARAIIVKDDQQRRDWTKTIHGADPFDSNLYDLVIRIDVLSVDDAVDIICQAAGSQGFQSTRKKPPRP